MRLHLRANYGLKEWEKIMRSGERVDINQTWELQSCAVAAWESAGPALQVSLYLIHLKPFPLSDSADVYRNRSYIIAEK
jgi:hypothetical protein